MNNQLSTTNQNVKLALLKSKSLIDITNKLLANRTSKDLVQSVENFRFSVISGHTGSVNSIAITPDGKYVVSGCSDNTIKLWDIQSGAIHVVILEAYLVTIEQNHQKSMGR